MKTFKGFDKDLKCRVMQYEIGKTAICEEVVIEPCKSGLHSCENPMDVLKYYPISNNNRYCVVVPSGKIVKDVDCDSKLVSRELTIEKEISSKELIEIGFKYKFDKIKWSEEDKAQTHGYNSAAQTHGDNSAAQTHGNTSAAQTHGDYSAAQTHGDYSAAQTHGYNSAAQTHGNASAAQTHGNASAAQTHGQESIAVSTGINGKASGIIGNWIFLVEWVVIKSKCCIKTAKTVKVDGVKIKENVLYTLKNRKIVEA
jgi:hypothetical protein